ncbi:hypothetical protein A7K69_18340 [Parageobacillus thermoglucosidasius]|uniref:Uncharacterized protein n=1 Tax=Parageobacillus thermoglucosidasius TaxID=1426 RepID=A0A1B7KUE0_PARTM|nr:hypothetical protein A7K69_18340 [Parageobacillus thermoglucosidasius]
MQLERAKGDRAGVRIGQQTIRTVKYRERHKCVLKNLAMDCFFQFQFSKFVKGLIELFQPAGERKCFWIHANI